MAQKRVSCRYCKQDFIPGPNKPGYANECPKCLLEKLSELKPSVSRIPRKSKNLSVQEKRDREQAEFEKSVASFVARRRKSIADPNTTESEKARDRLYIRLAIADKAKEIESIKEELDSLEIKKADS